MERRPPSRCTPSTWIFMQQLPLPCLQAMQSPQSMYGSTEHFCPGSTFSTPAPTDMTSTASSCPVWHKICYHKTKIYSSVQHSQARTDDTRVAEKRLVATVGVIVSAAHADCADPDNRLALAGLQLLSLRLADPFLGLLKDDGLDLM